VNGFFSKYFSKLFVQQWIIGVARYRLEDMIRTKTFDPAISWFKEKDADKFFADPFLYQAADGRLSVLLEAYSHNEGYGKIVRVALDKDLQPAGYEPLLDTGSHLSYPFTYTENGTTYVFPESGSSGKLSCYTYDDKRNTVNWVKDIIREPLLDSTITRYRDRYWLFGTRKGKDADNKLYIYFSDQLLGPYTEHPQNPVKTGLTASRPAGQIIEVDGVLYRPSQNSRFTYGGSITLNKISRLDETGFDEDYYMTIEVNRKNRGNRGMHGMHTINHINGITVVDGTRWRFAPVTKLRQFIQKIKEKRSSRNRSLPAAQPAQS